MNVYCFRFPQDPRLKEKLIKVIQRDRRDEYWLPGQFSRIFSSHFKENDLYLTPLGRRKVKSIIFVFLLLSYSITQVLSLA